MKKIRVLILLICLLIPLSFAGCKNKNKQTLSTPTISEIANGTIIFDSVKNAEYYTVSIDNNKLSINAQNSNYVQIVDGKVNYDASKIFVVGNTYSIKVKANSSKANSSGFSESYTYKYIGKVSAPINVQINTTTLTWNVVENASYYLVKVVTPNDKLLFDKDGNVLTDDSAETIEKADLTEYSFNSNQFDFGSLLTEAGYYKFYVKAVLTDGTTVVESDFSKKVTYTHIVELSAPTNGQIYNINNELHLLTAIDAHANAISISCANFERTIEINSSEESVNILSDNLLDINLTKYFESFIVGGQLTFDDITQYSFKTQSKFIATGANESFYIDSKLSSAILFENTVVLSAPTLSLDFSEANNCYVASWSCESLNLIGEFKVLVFTNDGLKEYKLDSNINSMLITDEFLAVAVKTIGVGNYLTSPISAILPNPDLNTAQNITVNNPSGSTITWTNVANAYYFIECGTNFKVLDTNSFEIPVDTLSSNNQTLTLATFVSDCSPRIKSINLHFTKKLDTPTFDAAQGFNSQKLYELTFTGSENAIGYYVYVKSKDATEFIKINTLYTSTAIDLSQYIITEGEYTDYEVKIQAVADIHSVYSNSELSEAVSVSHIKVLSKPEFYKINNEIIPISKQISNGTNKYILKFYGVQDAGSYEILINYNKLSIEANLENETGLYEVDVSRYLISANNYEIQLRAMPKATSFNISASEYSIANYTLTKQLPTVENIVITENEGVYTISFTPVDNAQSYRVRIVKENDSDYIDYLNELGLKNSFEITESYDISAYVKQQGSYCFYVTALAPKEDSYYADSNESTSYARVDKLTSLKAPTEITFENVSESIYRLSWVGDDNADYYLIRLTDPNNISYEFKVYNATNTNINNYVTIQGTYSVSIYSMVETTGGNSKEFTSSSATSATERYLYQKRHDFARYSIYSYGNSYNFLIDSASQLKNILWYHYLYGIDISTQLNLYINRPSYVPEGETEAVQKTLRETIISFAEDINAETGINSDEHWLALTQETTTSNKELFEYLCEKMLSIYPEFNVLSNFSVDHSTGSDIFTLYYENALNVTKIEYSNANQSLSIKANENYGNDFEYIDLYLRKSELGVFKIDSKPEMLVTTTEQLLHAVQHNRKPTFIGDSSVAEKVYSNAKLVLSAIVTDNMTDLEKVTAIFDWLEANFDLTYYSDVNDKYYLSGSLDSFSYNEAKNYGKYKHYYLEGIFEDISMTSSGEITIGSKYATSKSYSKAFTLLCAIEGIDSVVVNGYYTYSTTDNPSITVYHSWNKVNLSTTIDQTEKYNYVVDLTFSDNRIYYPSLNTGYGISSHLYFLTLDSITPNNITLIDKNNLISSAYKNKWTTPNENQYAYNYYKESTFSMTSDQIGNTIKNYYTSKEEQANYSINNYEKQYNSGKSYQLYANSGYASQDIQAYLLNALIYSKFKADNNTSGRSSFEFRINAQTFENNTLFDILTNKSTTYSLNLSIKYDSPGDYTLYTVKNTSTSQITIVFVVQKTA